MSGKITVINAISGSDLQKVYAIRKKVFVEEQHCPPELEYANEDESRHFLALYEELPCGACRWRKTGNGFKLERFAVLAEFRGKGVGSALVKAVLNDLPEEAKPVYLNSQLDAQKLYSAFGFMPVGEQFEEAGIMHQQMILA